ncbi:class I SAM-dependent methyltransferase [Streptomyces sp. WZ-12]|uniref:class I SAM-dependent methyltransferase n=1 Tax=Streptomyces sp. WZ-12 TaxID=3030210 RepID=UPI00238147BB|nr:class I SAM-dependent methyltransferase [Streptomyces sp. WZ-12]
MTPHRHDQHLHHHKQPEEHQEHRDHEAGLADLLDLDAEVLGPFLDEVTGWVRGQTRAAPRAIVDVGAGTGTGTAALARRFPGARLVAVDRSPVMLDRVAATARTQGLAERLRVVPADLDVAWPEIGAVDLAWLASSLHHAQDPDRLLRDLHGALRPGGLLVVIEMDGMPRFLPDDLGIGCPGLEARGKEAMARARWNAYPNWRPHLERAGFADVAERAFTFDIHPAPPAAHRYAHGVLRTLRHGLADQLAADDLDTLDRLLAVDAPESVLHRDDLIVRGRRIAWAARRP